MCTLNSLRYFKCNLFLNLLFITCLFIQENDCTRGSYAFLKSINERDEFHSFRPCVLRRNAGNHTVWMTLYQRQRYGSIDKSFEHFALRQRVRIFDRGNFSVRTKSRNFLLKFRFRLLDNHNLHYALSCKNRNKIPETYKKMHN